MIGARYLVPYVRLFPIWRYGPTYVDLFSARTEDRWHPVWFGQREFSSEAEALAWSSKQSPQESE